MIDLTENGGAQVFAVRSCSDSRLLCIPLGRYYNTTGSVIIRSPSMTPKARYPTLDQRLVTDIATPRITPHDTCRRWAADDTLRIGHAH